MLGERLLELRKDAGLTQDELAEILRINKHSISSYERNKSEPPDDIKVLIAKYFNISVDYLLGLVDSPLPIRSQQKSLRLPDDFSAENQQELQRFLHYLLYREKCAAE